MNGMKAGRFAARAAANAAATSADSIVVELICGDGHDRECEHKFYIAGLGILGYTGVI